MVRDRRYKPYSDCQIKCLDDIYTDLFEYKTHGFFVEIGAFDGQSFSNTCFLADIGWSGIYVEPVLKNYARCRVRHKNNNNINVIRKAIDSKTSRADIYLGEEYSTLCTETYQMLKCNDWSKNRFTNRTESVATWTLQQLLEHTSVKQGFDILVIDTEGSEWNILKKFDIKLWRPKAVIIELHENNPNYTYMQTNQKNIIKYFQKNNYKSIYSDEINTIYIHTETN